MTWIHFTAIVFATVTLFAAEPGAKQLRKDVHYLASDKLKGRAAGTPELESAGQFIARRFWKLGLKPASAGGWFQAVPAIADMEKSFDIRVTVGQTNFVLRPENARAHMISPGELRSAPVIKVDPVYLKNAQGQPLTGAVVLASASLPIAHLGIPSLIVYASDRSKRTFQWGPATFAASVYESPSLGQTTTLFSGDPALIEWVSSLPQGLVAGATVQGTTKANRRSFELHNVIGVLPGSDPVLRNSYVIVSAHYDGVGEIASGPDRIRNGANDNASGVTTMLAIARAISSQKIRLKRSVVFAAWSGEETGLLGSRFYARTPLFPLARTVANINIEQNGRYDGEGGSGPKRLLVTGFGFSDLGTIMLQAGKPVGVEVYPGPNEVFGGSDNLSLALVGIPAHSVGSSVLFPDYHAVSDSAEKLDYENMAVLTRAIAAAVLALATADKGPEWNANEPQAAPYRNARVALR